MLKDPGFDINVSNWTTSGGTLSRSLSDSELCPYSGSLTTTLAPNDPERIVTQCVRSTPLSGNYNFGAKIRVIGGMGALAICQAAFWSGFSCDGDTVVTDETIALPPSDTWQTTTPETTVPTVSVSGANSVAFNCYLFSDASVATTFYLDMLYVSVAPAHY